MKKKIMCLTLSILLISTMSAFASNVAGGKMTIDFDLSGYDRNREVKLWVPYPVSDENQTISGIEVAGNFESSGVYTDKKFKNTMLYAKWDKDTEERKLRFTFDATRNEVLKKAFPKTETAWDKADYAAYLAATKLGPVDGPVGALAEKITRGKKGVLAKARAVYDWTCENMYREPATRGCGSGDVCRLLDTPGGKCADISSVFVALARSAGVPAREILGIRMGKKKVQDVTTWQHCWAEFFLPGYGWVPVDPGDVRKMILVKKLAPGGKAAKEYKEYFWGGIEPYRIALSSGRDLTLNPVQEGTPVNYLMYPYAQVSGKTVDWLDPENFKYKITYTKHD